MTQSTPFERRVIAVAVTMAPIAMAVALFLAGYSQTHGSWWTATVQLAVLGGITIMIYGINVRAVPMHSDRRWPYPWLVALQVGAGIVGAWFACFGYGTDREMLIRAGHLLAFLGAALFQVNLRSLFMQPGPTLTRIAWHDRDHHQKVDRMVIPFTIISGLMVLVGTGLGVALDYWQPDHGRWDLVWAHLMLLGFFLAMAFGTSYHTLGRWSGRQFTSVRLVPVQIATFVVGLFAMATALGWDIDWLFRVGAVAMATAMVVWAINVVPVMWSFSAAIRTAMVLAIVFMLIGIGFGVLFAIDEVMGARLRTTHVMANLFGFAGLLISGFGYRYVPALSGATEIRWPALRWPQIALMTVGCSVGMLFMGLRMYGHIDAEAVLWPCLLGAVGMLLFAINLGATFAFSTPEPTTTIHSRERTISIDDTDTAP